MFEYVQILIECREDFIFLVVSNRFCAATCADWMLIECFHHWPTVSVMHHLAQWGIFMDNVPVLVCGVGRCDGVVTVCMDEQFQTLYVFLHAGLWICIPVVLSMGCPLTHLCWHALHTHTVGCRVCMYVERMCIGAGCVFVYADP